MFENSDIYNLIPEIVGEYIDDETARVRMDLCFASEITLHKNDNAEKEMIDAIRKTDENSKAYKFIQNQLSSRLLEGIIDFLDISYEEIIKAALVKHLSIAELQRLVNEYDCKKGKFLI